MKCNITLPIELIMPLILHQSGNSFLLKRCSECNLEKLDLNLLWLCFIIQTFWEQTYTFMSTNSALKKNTITKSPTYSTQITRQSLTLPSKNIQEIKAHMYSGCQKNAYLKTRSYHMPLWNKMSSIPFIQIHAHKHIKYQEKKALLAILLL